MYNQDNASRLQTLLRALDQSPSSVVITDHQGNIEYVNPRFSALTGYSLDEVVGKNPRILKSQVNPPEFYSNMWNTILSGRTWQGEFCNRKKNGELYWESASISPVFDDAGTIGHFVAVKEDITERKWMNDALRETLERYRLLFEHSHDGILLSAPDGRVFSANPVACALLGSSEREICEHGRQAFIDPTDERIPRLIDERERTGRAAGEMRFRKKDGTMFEAEVFSRRFTLTDGSVNSIVIFRDITARRQAEESLLLSEEKYHTLFSEMIDGAALHEIVCDENGQPVDYVTLELNRSFEHLLNVKEAEVVGKRASEILSPAELKHWLGIFGPVAITGKSVRYEMFSPQNKRFFEGVAYSPAKGKFAVTFSDVTERKESENALKDSLEQLHELGARLERLREEERKSISREVHDDLGQLLTALRFDVLKLKERGAGDQKEFETSITSILSVTNAAIKAVKDVAARLRPGMLDDLGLIAAIEWQTEEFQKLTGISCTLSLPKDEVPLDPDWSTDIFRILQEALTNITRHAKAQKVEVSFSDTPTEVRLSVKDDGVGISESGVRNPQSLGILGIRERLRQYGGVLAIQAVPGGGTELRVRIPKK